MSLECMSEDGRQAVFVGTMLQTGDAVKLCDECLVPWAAALLQAMTGVNPAPFIAAVSEPPVELQEPAPGEPLAEDPTDDIEGEPSQRHPGPTPADTSDRGEANGDGVGEATESDPMEQAAG